MYLKSDSQTHRSNDSLITASSNDAMVQFSRHAAQPRLFSSTSLKVASALQNAIWHVSAGTSATISLGGCGCRGQETQTLGHRHGRGERKKAEEWRTHTREYRQRRGRASVEGALCRRRHFLQIASPSLLLRHWPG
jgi:hypothetical protein